MLQILSHKLDREAKDVEEPFGDVVIMHVVGLEWSR